MSDEKNNKKQPKLVTKPFLPSTTVEGMGADWKGGSVHMHSGSCGGEECVQVKMAHHGTGNRSQIGLTVTALESFIKVGNVMLERIRADRQRRN